MTEHNVSMTEPAVLDDSALARRWYKDREEGITPEAIARWLDRISDRKRAGHLKSFKAGNKRLYRLEDVREYEARAKNFTSWLVLSEFTHDDLAEMFDEYGNLTWP